MTSPSKNDGLRPLASDPHPASDEDTTVMVDRALWQMLRPSAQTDAFANAWLALQSQFVGTVSKAALILPGPDKGNHMIPRAIWPTDATIDSDMSATAERAIADKRAVLRDTGTGAICICYPYLDEDRLLGAALLRLDGSTQQEARQAMRRLQWGGGWVELRDAREREHNIATERDRGQAAIDVLVELLEARGHRAAAMAAATATAAGLECDRVSVGLLRGKKLKVTAVSHTADMGAQLSLAQLIRRAMLECLDQGGAILRRASAEADHEEDTLVSRAHGELLRQQGAMSVLTLPLTDADGEVIGAMTLEHRDANGLTDERRDLGLGIGALIGPILRQKMLADRGWPMRLLTSIGRTLAAVLGPARLGAKLTFLLLAAAIFWAATAHTAFEVVADARLEGTVQRIVSAPFDGYLVGQTVRPGDRVTEGQVLAQLDDRDLRLRLMAAEAELNESEIERNAATALGRRTDEALLGAQIAQANAQIDLLRAQISRTELVAPFDGIVVSGDRTQELGAAISRGEELFVIAPLDDYRLRLSVEEGDIAVLTPGQVGRVRFAARPDETFPFAVERILSVASPEAGDNRFALEAHLEAPTSTGPDVLLPGMEGVARVSVEERLTVKIWTQDFVDWLRLATWRWMP
jgi:multidrug efflux pump subunit AcrA (membrane-fusion protein)